MNPVRSSRKGVHTINVPINTNCCLNSGAILIRGVKNKEIFKSLAVAVGTEDGEGRVWKCGAILAQSTLVELGDTRTATNGTELLKIDTFGIIAG